MKENPRYSTGMLPMPIFQIAIFSNASIGSTKCYFGVLCRAGDAPPLIEVGVLCVASKLEPGAANLVALEESLTESGGGPAITVVKEVVVSICAIGQKEPWGSGGG